MSDLLTIIRLQNEYIEFLSECAKKPSAILQAHGFKWSEEDLQRGSDLRQQIRNAKMEITARLSP